MTGFDPRVAMLAAAGCSGSALYLTVLDHLHSAAAWLGRLPRRAWQMACRWLAERLDRIDPPADHHAPMIPGTPGPSARVPAGATTLPPRVEAPGEAPAPPPPGAGASLIGEDTTPLPRARRPWVLAQEAPGSPLPVRHTGRPPWGPAPKPTSAVPVPEPYEDDDPAPVRVPRYADPHWLLAERRESRFGARNLAVARLAADAVAFPGWDCASVRFKAMRDTRAMEAIA